MWTYQYKHGDRPLEGYTIQRAAGRGGFGEVYYALSDSGREIALKAVQGYEQIELRGISQCMNLKSPHLVSIFDVKHNEQGRPFVIMEFVNGPSLRQLLDESPSGLGEQKSAFFLREIAKGLTFLHDCGIVHRDLKPGNIFYENGYVKIGDYGLSKAITVGQTSQQTVTVGTVHYMAPEIGAGRYDRSIDIYAMGAVLFEMLTGTVPFVGASPSEILMKHLSAEPDCKGISEPFATVIKKAMQKDPTRRYQSVQEMVEAVFGAEHVRNSMSVFAAEDLSMVAGRVANKMNIGAGAPVAESSSVVGNTPIRGGTMWDRMGDRFDRAGDRVAQMGEGLFAGPKPDNSPLDFDELNARDSMSKRDRRLLAIFTSLGIALAAGVMSSSHGAPIGYAIAMFCTTWGATLGICASWRWMMPKMADDSPTAKRFAAAMLAVGGALGFSAVNWLVIDQTRMVGTWIAIIIAFLLNDSRQWIDPSRSDRVRIKYAVSAAFTAWIATLIFSGSTHLAVAVVAGTALMVQVLTPWDPRGAEERRNSGKRGFDVVPTPPSPPLPPSPPQLTPLNVELGGRRAQAFAVTLPGDDCDVQGNIGSTSAPIASRVPPRWIRVACMILFAAMFTGGVMLLIGAANRAFAPNQSDEAIARGVGIGLIIAGACALVRSMIGRYVSFFQFIIRPTLLLLCFESIVISSVITGGTPNMQGDEKMIGLFFMIFPAVLFLTILLISWQFGDGGAKGALSQTAPTASMSGPVSPHNRGIALGLSALGMFGVNGLHRLYVGKIGTGVLWLCTFGLFGIGQLIDFIVIACGGFRDAQDRIITQWENTAPIPSAAARQSAPPASDRPWAGISPLVDVGRQHGERLKAKLSQVDVRVREHSAYLRGRRSTRTESGGLLSVLAGFLIFASVVLGLGLALDATGFIAAGLPNPSVAKEVEAKFFQDPEWPSLMRTFGAAACGITLFIGLCATVFARRRGGFGYILRGIIGSIGMLLAMIPLSTVVRTDSMWKDAAPLFHKSQISAGVNEVLSNFQHAPVYFAGAIFLVSLIILAVPAPRKRRGGPRVTMTVDRQPRGGQVAPAQPAAAPVPAPSANAVADSSTTEPSSASSAAAAPVGGEKGA
ncbi:hypothetical protein BH09PLA1_BH09PLA1_34730 [soil metagenome]